MTYLARPAPGIAQTSSVAGMLDAVRARAKTELAPAAPSIDHDGVYPAALMQGFGADGAFAPHLRAFNERPDLGAAIEAMTEIAASCMSTGFCTWCQDALGWYLENSENTALRERLQPGIARGEVLGGTGLSNPVKALAGIENFKLRAQRTDGGYIVSGVLPWVSNLGDGHWFGTVFQDGTDPARKMMAMVQCGQPGVVIKQNARFIALEGTGTYSVLFRKAFIADENMLADPLGGMVGRIKPGFILLQTGMGLGVIRACIDLMREADVTLGKTNAWLPKRPDDFDAEFARTHADVMAAAADPTNGSADHMRAVFRARLAVGELALSAAQSALLHWGARGYIEGSPVNRRLRESYFVAIITPSIKHLRQELAALETKH